MRHNEEPDSLPLMNRSGQSRSGYRLLLVTLSLVSVIFSLLPTITFLYLLIDDTSWDLIMSHTHRWLEHNHWDVKVTQIVWRALDLVDDNHSVILLVLFSISATNIILSLMLTCSSIILRRGLMVPWMVFNAFIIFIMFLVFIAWTFLSFFISILLAIIFPVIAGLILGVWILIWRKTHEIHSNFYSFHRKVGSVKISRNHYTRAKNFSRQPRSS